MRKNSFCFLMKIWQLFISLFCLLPSVHLHMETFYERAFSLSFTRLKWIIRDSRAQRKTDDQGGGQLKLSRSVVVSIISKPRPIHPQYIFGIQVAKQLLKIFPYNCKEWVSLIFSCVFINFLMINISKWFIFPSFAISSKRNHPRGTTAIIG